MYMCTHSHTHIFLQEEHLIFLKARQEGGRAYIRPHEIHACTLSLSSQEKYLNRPDVRKKLGVGDRK